MLWLTVSSAKSLPNPNVMPEPTREQIGEFYLRLGSAVASWQFVEASLGLIFSSAIGTSPTSYKAVLAAFHTPTNFRTRLDMTNEAVERATSENALITKWHSLRGRTRNQSKTRNAIAHSIVMFDPSKKTKNQLFLSPNVSDPTRFSGQFSQKNIITQTDLENAQANFEALNQELWDFAHELPRPVRLT